MSDPRIEAALKAYGPSGLDIRSHTHAMTEALAAADRVTLEGAPELLRAINERVHLEYSIGSFDTLSSNAKMLEKAAAALTVQAAEIAQLRKALKPVAELVPSSFRDDWDASIILNARAALEAK